MSDSAKKGGEESGGGSNFFVDSLFWILLVLVVIAVIKGFASSLNISFDFIPSAGEVSSVVFNTVQVFSVFISLVFVMGIIYFNFKLSELAHHGHDHGHDDHHVVHHKVEREPNKRWTNIQSKLASANEADWRLGIIESDILLNEMLERMGYSGETIAEKLKQVEKADFNTIDLAWEAHKVRNRIAHDGGEFHINKQEALRVIGLYQKVFEEFYFI